MIPPLQFLFKHRKFHGVGKILKLLTVVSMICATKIACFFKLQPNLVAPIITSFSGY